MLRVVGEAGGKYAHRLRHEQPGGDQQHHLRQEQQREDAVGEQLRRSFALLTMDMRVSRHERGIERALGENRAEVIGQAEGDEERVRHGACAEDRRQHDVARETGEPRKQRIAANGEDASEHAPLLAHFPVGSNHNHAVDGPSWFETRGVAALLTMRGKTSS